MSESRSMSHLPNKPCQLLFIQPPTRTHTTTLIHAKGLDHPDRLRHILGVQPASQEQQHSHSIPYHPADLPIICASRPTQFLDRQGLITRIEQDAIDIRSYRDCLLQRFLTCDMNNLHERNAG